ncbi:hypothetical protein [Brucella pseudogrignonensis]|uniref:hypothetical protein n=1 Tax=Brucella pseudogrignonensis TaxID=419475 RepID=UPI003ECED155
MASKETFSGKLADLTKTSERAFTEALAAFKQAQTVGHPDYFKSPDDEPDRHYDRNGYCDNPSRGY